MSLTALFNKTAMIKQMIQSDEVDELGNEVRTPHEFQSPCEAQQVQSDEPEQAGEAALDTWKIYLPTGTDIRTGDEMVIEGIGKFELVGNGWDARQGSPDVWHVECVALRVELWEGNGS